MLAVGTGLLLTACGGSKAPEEQAVNDETTTSETATESESTTYAIDPGTSNIKWSGTMLGIYSHEGTIAIKSGSVTISNGEVTSATLEVDMTSITPTDENYDEEKTSDKLVGHLSSPDFFDVENHPTSSISFSNSSGGSSTAQLTVRGITNDEELKDLKVKESEGKFMAMTELTFDRTKYDVSFAMPTEDMVISNDIELVVSLSGTSE